MRASEDIARVDSEAGIIATLFHHPEYSFYSEDLLPNHFTNKENRYISPLHISPHLWMFPGRRFARRLRRSSS